MHIAVLHLLGLPEAIDPSADVGLLGQRPDHRNELVPIEQLETHVAGMRSRLAHR